jgi:hypothetical protein
VPKVRCHAWTGLKECSDPLDVFAASSCLWYRFSAWMYFEHPEAEVGGDKAAAFLVFLAKVAVHEGRCVYCREPAFSPRGFSIDRMVPNAGGGRYGPDPHSVAVFVLKVSV